MSIAERLARPEILAMAAADIAGAPVPGTIRLDANENPFPPLGYKGPINRYPDPQPDQLRRRLAALYGVAPASLWATRGSDDAIDLLIRTFCRPGRDGIMIVEPGFSAYAHFAAIQGAAVISETLAKGFAFDVARIVEAARKNPPKLLFLCSPNNPVGTEISAAEIRAVAAALPDTLVVLDEAYGEFASQPSLAPQAGSIPNLAVLRTLSKAYGLAGARIGCLIAAPDIVAVAARASPPYPLPEPSIRAALDALSPERMPVHRQRIARLVAERDRLADALRGRPGIDAIKAGGNFLFLEVAEPEELASRLAAAGIRVRFRPLAAPGGVRITIGNEEENAALLAVFGVGEAGRPGRRAELVRDTGETRIAVSIDLDAEDPRAIDTGIGFYDHMLDQVAAHGGFALTLSCTGDTGVDAHHSIEDVALAFGAALRHALGEKRGIGRFGFVLPMDECRAEVLVDLSGRPFSKFEGTFDTDKVGELPTEMVPHIFRSLSDALGASIHVRVDGDNDHHRVEACFKAFGRALRQGFAIESEAGVLPSTKGTL